MQGIEQLLAAAVAPLVRGNDLPVGHHLDVIDVALHGHGAERPASRYAVAIPVKAHRLVLVHLARLKDTTRRTCAGESAGPRLCPVQSERRLDTSLSPQVRSRAVKQQRRKWAFNWARSFTRGTGVAHCRCRSNTRFSTRGFSVAVAGKQNFGVKGKCDASAA